MYVEFRTVRAAAVWSRLETLAVALGEEESAPWNL